MEKMILVVDDDAKLRQMLHEYLRERLNSNNALWIYEIFADLSIKKGKKSHEAFRCDSPHNLAGSRYLRC